MAKWFVHLDLTYYPTSLVVEAETAEQAADLALTAAKEGLYGQTYSRGMAVAVMPFDDVLIIGDKQAIEDMCEPLRTEDA